jgi:hypothetical protein
MANYRAVVTGNWSAGATWGGGAAPPDGEGHNIYSNGFTVTIDQNVNVNLISNAAITASFVGGGTSAAVAGTFNLNDGFTVTSTSITGGANAAPTILYSGTTSASIISGTITAGTIGGQHAIRNSGSGTLNITGNCNGLGSSGNAGHAVYLSSAGTINITGNLTGGSGSSGTDSLGGTAVVNKGVGTINVVSGNVTGTVNPNHGLANISTGVVNIQNGNVTSTGAGNGVFQNAAGTLLVNGNVTASASAIGINASAGTVTVVGNCTATNGFNAISNNGTVKASGSFIYSSNGTLPISAPRILLDTTPTLAYTRYALNGIGSYVDMFTADNTIFGSPAATDVRSGVVYANGNYTGRLTVPARGSVALNVDYGPSMPFTATRSGTTATATLSYSYPFVAGDQITVTGAFNSEWNGTYTIASIVSGTSVTFTVPATHSATAGTGANMQTTGTAVLDPAAVASAVWGAATRTLTAGAGISASDVWDYATRSLTTSSAPSVVQIRQEMDANSTKLANLDATVSSRLAPSGTLATVTTLTNAPTVPTAAAIATQVRTELTTELNRLDTNVASRAASGTLASDVTAIKAKTDAINVDRINNTATTAIVGNLLAQANS